MSNHVEASLKDFDCQVQHYPLHPLWEQKLHASNLTDDTIERSRFRTEYDLGAVSDLLEIPFDGDLREWGALVIPFFTPKGEPARYHVVRFDPPPTHWKTGKPAKYLSPASRPMLPYFPFFVDLYEAIATPGVT